MTQHFTRNTVSAQFYCSTCNGMTLHRIDDRRKGPCLECIARLEEQHKQELEQAANEEQAEMFPDE